MEILAAFDLMGSLRAAADVAGLPITPSPGWSPNATPGARDSLSGPVRRLDRSARFTWGGHGFTSGHSGAGSVVGSAVGDRETVGVVATPIARAGCGDWLPGQFREWTVGAIHAGWSRSRPFLG